MPYIFPNLPKTRRASRVFCRFAPICALLAVGGFSIGGCGREVQGGQENGSGALSMPADGFVKVISLQIKDRADAPPPLTLPEGAQRTDKPSPVLHYHWSLIGERNWQNPKADKTGFTLGDAYPLNSTTRRGGCFAWECDLVAQSFQPGEQSKPTSAVAWKITIHGSNGQTATADGVAYQNAIRPVEEVVRVVQTRDEPVRLPTDVVLATITDPTQPKPQEIRLRVADK